MKKAALLFIATIGCLVFPALTFAVQSPPGCTESALSISLSATPAQVSVGGTISYSADVFNGPGNGGVACDATNIQASITTPDGVIHPINLTRTTLTDGQSDSYDNAATFTVSQQGYVGADGTVRASAQDSGDIQNVKDCANSLHWCTNTGGGSQLVSTPVVPLTVGGATTTGVTSVTPPPVAPTVGGATTTGATSLPPTLTVGGTIITGTTSLPPVLTVGGATSTGVTSLPSVLTVGGTTTGATSLPPALTVGGSGTGATSLPPTLTVGGALLTGAVSVAPVLTVGGTTTTGATSVPTPSPSPVALTVGGTTTTGATSVPPVLTVGGATSTGATSSPSPSPVVVPPPSSGGGGGGSSGGGGGGGGGGSFSSGGGGGSIAPQIKIVKTANPPTLYSGPGQVTYTYTVTNPGILPLSNVILMDNTCTAISAPTGDVNGDDILEPTETWTYQCTMTLQQTTTNIARVQGTANAQTVYSSTSLTVPVGYPTLPNTGYPPLNDTSSWYIIFFTGLSAIFCTAYISLRRFVA